MTVCVDTNVVIVVFAAEPEFLPLRAALSDGVLNWALSTEILLEYEEISRRNQGSSRWEALASLIGIISDLYGTILRINPHFRFNVITHDPDDNKFVDCAIAAEADFVITEDAHFSALLGSGYKPQPITPQEFTERFLSAGAD